MKCLNCNCNFPRRVVIDGVNKDFKNRKYCLECSPLDGHNTRPLVKPQIEPQTTPQLGPIAPQMPENVDTVEFYVAPQLSPICDCLEKLEIDEYNISKGWERCRHCKGIFQPKKKIKNGDCLDCFLRINSKYIHYQLVKCSGDKCSKCRYDKFRENIMIYNVKLKEIYKPNDFSLDKMLKEVNADYILFCRDCMLIDLYDDKEHNFLY